MTVLEADRNGLTKREIAELFWGRARVEEEYYVDGWMHSLIKRRLAKARAMLKAYRDIASGRH